jgi:hypothetical protein
MYLNLNEFVDGAIVEDMRYELNSICLHHGYSTKVGHYTSK